MFQAAVSQIIHVYYSSIGLSTGALCRLEIGNLIQVIGKGCMCVFFKHNTHPTTIWTQCHLTFLLLTTNSNLQWKAVKPNPASERGRKKARSSGLCLSSAAFNPKWFRARFVVMPFAVALLITTLAKQLFQLINWKWINKRQKDRTTIWTESLPPTPAPPPKNKP